MSHNITIEGGTTVRLPTAGKYCDRDIVITALGGGTGKPEQEKTVEITENGTHEVIPDDGYALSKVTVNVDVPAGSAEDDVGALLSNTMTTLDNSVVTSLRSRACQGATKLVTVNLPKVTSVGTYAFYGCSGLVTVSMPVVASVPSQCFYSCSNLQKADMGLVKSLAAQSFHGAYALTALILRKTDAICTLNNTTAVSGSGIGKGTGYAYVPAALVDSYKADEKWSTYADQIRAIEDYPDICGVSE